MDQMIWIDLEYDDPIFYSLKITVNFHHKSRGALPLRIAFELNVWAITVFFRKPVSIFNEGPVWKREEGMSEVSGRVAFY